MIRRSSYHNHLPLPLIKGKGIKGIGLPNKRLKGEASKQSQLENEHLGSYFGKPHYIARDNAQ